MKNIAVLTSGGDSPGMNSAIRAVARTCGHYDIKCTGIIRGYSGLIENDTKNLYTRSVRGIINRGGTFLYSCLLYTSPSPRDLSTSRMPSSA